MPTEPKDDGVALNNAIKQAKLPSWLRDDWTDKDAKEGDLYS